MQQILNKTENEYFLPFYPKILSMIEVINNFLGFTFIFILLFFPGHLHAQNNGKILVEKSNSLTEINDAEAKSGYAGMVGGIVDNIIIAAGGANFPNALPWEGGEKVYSDKIFVHKNNKWSIADKTLPHQLAYSSSVTVDDGILVIGGENNDTTFNDVFLIHFNKNGEIEIDTHSYADLPTPLAYTAVVRENNFIYVVGGKTKTESVNSFFRLDIQNPTEWQQLEDLPGKPRALHTAAIQETQHSRKLFIIGGRNQQAGKKSQPLATVYSYDLARDFWQKEQNLQLNGEDHIVMGASAYASGSMHILVYGGSDEKIFNRLETIALQLSENLSDSLTQSLIRTRDSLLNKHPGFSKNILAYNTITKQWFQYAKLKDPLPVTALSWKTDDRVTILSGEQSPGIRTPEMIHLQTASATKPFGIVNYTVLALYLLISLVVGVYFSSKQQSTTDYFKGGGRIPWWAAGLSVFGTLLSAITFMAIPAKSFITDWSYFFLNIAAIVITPLIAYLFIPYFNKLKIATAYEFLENRFNYLARAIGSLSFILFQLGRIGIVLLLPSLAISIVTGISVEMSILIMGGLCIIYTTFGGIEAVVWTDVLQVIVLMGGSILAIVWIIVHTNESVGEMYQLAKNQDKFNLADLSFTFTESTFWVVFFGGLASAMVSQGTDQTIVQRYLTSDSIKDSQKTIYTNAVLTLPATIIFFGLGTLLFIFYSEMPNHLSADISNNDSILPWYIVNELPTGISGLLIAGVFSAAMSSISSSLNSVSTAFCNDFYKQLRPAVRDERLLNIARIATVVTGLVGVAFALWMANSDIKSLWDQFYKFLGLFTGGLGGMFLLGMLTKKANTKGTLLGLLFSAIFIWFISTYTQIHILMYSLLGVASSFITGYLFSYIFSEK